MRQDSDRDDRNHLQQNPMPFGWQEFTFMNESEQNLSSRNRELSLQQPEHSVELEQSHLPDQALRSLATTQIGDRVRIVSLNCGEFNNRLMGMGVMPDVILEVISCTATGSVIVALQDQRLGLGAEMAQRIQVIGADQPLEILQPISTTKIEPMQTTSDISSVKLRDAAIGSVLRVIGYEPTARDYKRKLLAMGLTPGTELRVMRHAPLGDPTEIEVRDFHLSLRKNEADALIVIPVTGEES